MAISDAPHHIKAKSGAVGWVRHVPNTLSVLRLVLVIPIAEAIGSSRWQLATALFIIAAVSDMADGTIARLYKARSRLGEMLDPIADKALLVTTALALASVGQLPWWLAGTVLLRDALILAGALISWLLQLGHALLPLLLGKASTVAQMALMAAILLAAGEHVWAEPLIWPLKISVVLLAATSGLIYVMTWSRGLPAKKPVKTS